MQPSEMTPADGDVIVCYGAAKPDDKHLASIADLNRLLHVGGLIVKGITAPPSASIGDREFGSAPA